MLRIFSIGTGLLSLLLLAACSRPTDQLSGIIEDGELRVITLNGPTTFYAGPHGPAGLEYELVSRFAHFLKVKPRFIIPERFADILPAIARGEADLAAAGITVTRQRQQQVRFSTPYQTIRSQVVYLGGTHRPRDIEDLPGRRIAVIAGSSHEARLVKLQQQYPQLTWTSIDNTLLEDVFADIVKGKYELVIADSNEIAVSRRYFPNVKVAFTLPGKEHLAWALPLKNDSSLYTRSVEFFSQLEKSGVLDELLERYYGHVERLNFVDKRSFWRHYRERLPEYIADFKKAAEQYAFDWRLLAAIGYQESHWDPQAVSPTGVRGLMMLTLATARQVGIEDRQDPAQSILGGARYLRRVEKKIPERIQQPDRLWLTLAGYNVGFGHLEDARILAQRNGGNPDKWLDVKRYLPELSKPEVYKTLRHGYARGHEPVRYVENIRNYYELLQWRTTVAETKRQRIFEHIPKAL